MQQDKLTGRIFSYIGGLANIYVASQDNFIKAKAKGIFRHDKMEYKPMVGDYVKLTAVNDTEFVISEILERDNSLIRPKVANVDEVILIQSVKEPDLNLFLLNKYLAFFESRIGTVKIALSKIDLLSETEKQQVRDVIAMYRHDGYTIYDLSQESDFLDLKTDLSSKTVCLAGNSGVGKSTLLNRIDANLALRTQEISKALNRGKHTTTNVGIVQYQNGYLIDTPGFSSLEVNLTKEQLAYSFHDFREISCQCKFSNCLHLNEPQCAIKQAVIDTKISQLRYDDYLRLMKEIK